MKHPSLMLLEGSTPLGRIQNRLLENGEPALLQNGATRELEKWEINPQFLPETSVSSSPASQVSVVYPKTVYSWTDRTGITTPDISGSMSTSGLTITSSSNAGTLVVTADGTHATMQIGVAVVLWNELANPIGVVSTVITTSGWLKNSAGNYIAANAGISYQPGFFAVDVSLAAGFTVLVQTILPSGTVNLHWKLF